MRYVALDELSKDQVGDDALDLVEIDVVGAAPREGGLEFGERDLVRLRRVGGFAVNGVHFLEQRAIDGHAKLFEHQIRALLDERRFTAAEGGVERARVASAHRLDDVDKLSQLVLLQQLLRRQRA